MEDAMTCPECGSLETELVKVVGGSVPRRRRTCLKCEARWTTREAVEQGSVWRKGDPIPKGGRPMHERRLSIVRDKGAPVDPLLGKGAPVGSTVDLGFSSSLLTLPSLADPDQSARSQKRAKKPDTKLIRDLNGVVRMPFTADF